MISSKNKAAIAFLALVCFSSSAFGLTASERKIVLRAKQHLQEAQAQFKSAVTESILAGQRAEEAEKHAAQTDIYAAELQKQIDAAHANEEALAKQNAQMRPVYEQCTKWWGLGAIMFGIGTLIKHLLVLAIVIVVIGVLLFIASFFFPVIGVGLSAAKNFIGIAIARLKLLLQRKRKNGG